MLAVLEIQRQPPAVPPDGVVLLGMPGGIAAVAVTIKWTAVLGGR
jgi:hypothetical protein